MFIDLSDFIQNENEIYREIENEVLDMDLSMTDTVLVSPVKYKLGISKVNKDLLADLSIEYTVEKPCDRCLKLARESVVTRYQAKLVDESCKDILEDEEDLSEYEYMEKNRIEIDRLAREVVVISLPMKSLCDENCEGLCPVCGIDLNNSECDCEKAQVDPRLDILKGLKL